METDPTASLHNIVAAIQRRWGSRALRFLRDPAPSHPPVLPTGFAELDTVLAIGGLPRGRITELLGTPTSGLTTIALTTLAQAQAHGNLAAYVDLSRAFDAEVAAALGVDLDTLLLVRPSSAEDALTIIQALATSGGVGMLVVDALALLQSVPADAALLAQALRVLPAALAASPCALVVLTPLPYSPPMTRAIGFQGSLVARAATVRLHVVREDWQITPQHVGCIARVTVLKHRLAPAAGSLTLPIAFDHQRSRS